MWLNKCRTSTFQSSPYRLPLRPTPTLQICDQPLIPWKTRDAQLTLDPDPVSTCHLPIHHIAFPFYNFYWELHHTLEFHRWRKLLKPTSFWQCVCFWMGWRFYVEYLLPAAQLWRSPNHFQQICWTARSMERSIFFFLKIHISAPGERNCPNFFF